MARGYITLNTDASFCPYTGASGYAFTVVYTDIKGDTIREKLYGTMTPSNNPTHAEFKCIENGIDFIISVISISTGKLIINTDCKLFIDRWNGLNPSKNTYEGEIRSFNNCRWLIENSPWITCEPRHVKAHTGSSDARSKVNAWADKMAKECMRKERKRLNKIKGWKKPC